MKFIILVLVFWGNSLIAQNSTELRILKKYALCGCISINYHAVDSTFVSRDASKSYIFQIKGMDNEYLERIDNYTKKNTSNFYRNGVQENLEDSKANYIFWDCMDFYESKELDNYIKNILRKSNTKK